MASIKIDNDIYIPIARGTPPAEYIRLQKSGLVWWAPLTNTRPKHKTIRIITKSGRVRYVVVPEVKMGTVSYRGNFQATFGTYTYPNVVELKEVNASGKPEVTTTELQLYGIQQNRDKEIMIGINMDTVTAIYYGVHQPCSHCSHCSGHGCAYCRRDSCCDHS